MKKIVNTVYRVTSEKIPKAFDGVKICMLSDLHDNVYGISLERLYDMIDSQKPEIVIFAGDLLTRKKSEGSDSVIEFLSKVTSKYPVFYANGNHETKVNVYRERYGDRYDLLMKELKRIGVKILNNDSCEYRKNGESIRIYGLELEKDFFNLRDRPALTNEYMEKAVGNPSETYNILIAHNPMFFEEYVRWGANLVFSGHVHGGIVKLPFIGGVLNPDYTLFPKYDGGSFKSGKTEMLLGRGLGTHTINLRINNPPELVTAILFKK